MTRFPLSGKDGGKRERNTHNAVFPLRKSPKNGKILYFPPSFPYVGDNKNPLCLFFHCALRGCKVEEKGGGALAAGYFGIGGWSLVTLPSIGDLFPPPPINWETRGCKHAFLIWLGGDSQGVAASSSSSSNDCLSKFVPLPPLVRPTSKDSSKPTAAYAPPSPLFAGYLSKYFYDVFAEKARSEGEEGKETQHGTDRPWQSRQKGALICPD